MRLLLLFAALSFAEPMPVGGARREMGVVKASRGERVVIPAGSFRRGGKAPDEGAESTQAVPAFTLDRHEVTVTEFEAFVAAGAYQKPALWSSEGQVWLRDHPAGAGAVVRAADRGPDHPVVAVSWYEADAYCRARGGALPTEAQWERACHLNGERYPWGNEENFVASWYGGGKGGQLAAVLTTSALESDASVLSAEGVMHLSGNVWEWTADHYGPYDQDSRSSPWRTLRGGSYTNLASYCTCSHREPAMPEETRLTVGFRCVGP